MQLPCTHATDRARPRYLGTIAIGTVAVLVFPAWAQQEFPQRPIRMIVPYPPGGPTDIMGRLTAEVLQRGLGQNVIVDNRGGAATAIGAEMAARAPADGYTVLVSSETTFAVTPALKERLPYHPERDFAPVSLLTTQPYVLAVTNTLPVQSVSQLIAHAKANPGKLGFGSAGAGSANHLAGEMFKQAAGIDSVHIPYKGNGPAIVDLISGQIAYMLGSISSLYPHAASKKLRTVAVAAARRSATLPEVPTFTESGMVGYQVSGWNCIVVPKNTPPAVIRRLNGAIVSGFAAPDVVERLRKQSIDPAVGTPEQLAAHIQSEFARYGKLIKSVKLKVD
ncbi:MAG: tripartite tricarboxylate transporter substrate binding protein [Burkholderiales bacterium]|nr:tripartite tricarboxylate transporter substrate binding protein [Burkholderiales bacterium]